ncbi:MAG: transporter substrate-binding domain-containing protein [Rhodospirillales bacterium]|nr:transporter substrate-binding domain-containing protein [Rhodospirillales bacterium]
MHNKKRCIIFLFSLFIWVPDSFAAERNNLPEHATFAVYEFFPFGYKTKSGETKGLFVEIAQAISRSANIEIDIALLPIPRALRSLSNGRADFLIGGVKSPFLEGMPILSRLSCHHVMIGTNSKTGITDLATARGKRIGFLGSGAFVTRYAVPLGLIPTQATNSDSLHKMLQHGRVDGLFLTDAVFNAQLKTGRFAHKSTREEIEATLNTFINVATLPVYIRGRGNERFPGINSQINDAIKKVMGTETIRDIYRKWGSESGGNCSG